MQRRSALHGALALLALVALAGCGGTDAAQSLRGGPLLGTWALAGPVRAEITFAGQRVTGVAPVNTYRGPFEADGAQGAISVGPLATTQIGGSPEDMAAEADYLRALESAASYAADERTLTMYDAEDDAVLIYDRHDPVIVGAWEVTGFNNGREAVVSPSSGSALTATFGDDLTLAGHAGVNDYRTTYTAADGAQGAAEISVAPPATTRKAGPAELMEQELLFLRALESAATYTIQADQLVLRDASDAIAVTLTRS